MNELQDFINCFKKEIILILEEITKELKKEEEQKNDSINDN